MHRHAARRPTGDRGSIAPLVPIMGLVMLLLGGVVIDGARLLNTRGRAVAYAEEAARAGASAVMAGSATLGLDEPLARERVIAYCAAVMSDPELQASVTTCELDVDGATSDGFEEAEGIDGVPRRVVVRVRVSMEMRTSLIGILGIDTLQARAVARARPFEGTTGDDLDFPPPPVNPAPITPVEPPGGVGVDGPTELPPVLPPDDGGDGGGDGDGDGGGGDDGGGDDGGGDDGGGGGGDGGDDDDDPPAGEAP